MSQWIYDGRPLDGTEPFIEQFTSFVYRITHNESGRVYFGKKKLHFIRHKRPSGAKRRRKVVRPSDWLTYWGSNDYLKAQVEREGESAFTREIIRFCRRLSEANYYELREQMVNDVLLYPDKYYNGYVGSRISRKQLGVKDAWN